MTFEHMRSQVADVYRSDRWRKRVALMGERQVIAIYHNMKERGQFMKKKKRRIPESEEYAEQITFMKMYPELFKRK